MSRKGRTWRKRHQAGNTEPKGTSSNTEKTHIFSGISWQSIQHETSFIRLLEWMRREGFKAKNLRPAVFSDTGRGLMTRVPVKPGDTIIEVPRNLLITSSNALESYVGKAVDCCGGSNRTISALQALCLYLVYEKHRGESSFWYPYIASLPDVFSTPAFFSAQERFCLPGHLQEKAKAQLDAVRKDYEDILDIAAYIERRDVRFTAGLTWDLYLWAWGVVNTRSVYMEQPPHPLLKGEDRYALVPFLDMLNHDSKAKVKAEFNRNTNSYVIQSFDTYKPHDQVFICYGPHDNAKLLTEYGFILPRNPHNTVVFAEADFDVLKPLFPPEEWKNKLAVIKENDLMSMLCSSLDGPSWNLQCFLKLLLKNYQKRISCGEYLMSEPTESEKCQMKKILSLVLKEKLKLLEKCVVLAGECRPSYHTSMISALLEQMVGILKKCNRRNVTFDIG